MTGRLDDSSLESSPLRLRPADASSSCAKPSTLCIPDFNSIRQNPNLNPNAKSVYSGKVIGQSTQTSRHRTPRGSKPLALRATSLICVILLALITVVQVAHVHPAATDSDHCPLCVVMHSAAPVAAVAPTTVFVTGAEPIAVPVVHTVARPWHCSLFNRPPPQA